MTRAKSSKTKTTTRATRKPRVVKEKRRTEYHAAAPEQTAAPKTAEVKITRAKGRPMLQWVGKKPLVSVTAYPAQLIERFDPTNAATPIEFPRYDDLKDNWQNLLLYGDNKDVLANLLANGFRNKVNLIYIDPPFDSGADYIRRVELRGMKGNQLEGEYYDLGEQIQYTDIWANDNYLQFMYERLLLLKELLAEDGAIVMHCDYHKGHFLRSLMEEVFGLDNFRNEIITKRVQKNFAETEFVKSMNNAYDVLLLYAKGAEFRLLPPRKRTDYDYSELENWHSFDAPNWSGGRPNLTYELFGQMPPGANVWRWTKEKAEQAIKEGKLRQNPKTGKPEYLVDGSNGQMVNNLWVDILAYSNDYKYPTEKNERLLERVVTCFSLPGQFVLDCFVGSGTTTAVAQKLGRRWIAADINKGAIQTTSKRLQGIILEQVQAAQKTKAQPPLPDQGEGRGEGDNPQQPAALSFAVYRVNDYDLQMQHNEAANLAVEHLGITRTRTDNFFDGTRGKQLVKIIPFNHPCTLLDLQLIDDELKKREENRDILVVCLGKETTVDQWVADWNKRRPVTRRDPKGKPIEWLNRIEIVELRTDKKYGGFFVHQPNHADVTIERDGDKVVIDIRDFISPTIIERLKQDQNLFSAKISDWRAMVDVVLIDTDYDGKVFNIVHSDVPEKKNDLVEGRCELPAPRKGATVAVKIVDMLGEEIVVTKQV